MPVITINRMVDKKRKFGKKWSAEEEERHKGSLPPPLLPPKKSVVLSTF
jgi:hypothetical protein